MNATDFSQLTIKELRLIALENDIEIIGDKRLKTTYINAIETFQSQQILIKIIEPLPAIPDSLTKAAVMAARSATLPNL